MSQAEYANLLRAAGFDYITRAGWGSPRERDGSYARRAANSSYRLPMGLPYHYLHITVTRDTDTISEGAVGARQVEGYGYSTPPMVSYQDLVTNEGLIFQGQSLGVKGTHTVNDKGIRGFPEDLNREGYATAIMQNVEDPVTDIQVQAVAATFAAREILGYVKRGAPIFPHRMFAWKSCPGDKMVDRLQDVVDTKNRMVREGLDDMYSDADRRRDVNVAEDTDKIIKMLKTDRKRDAKKWRKVYRQNANTHRTVDELLAEYDKISDAEVDAEE